MQIDALKIYCGVVRLHSFSRGAEANHVLQATASLTVQRLEKHLGVTLIDRGCRPWKPTREGLIFYEGCREVLERYFNLESEVRGQQVAADTVVRVAAIYSVNLREISRCVHRFNELRCRKCAWNWNSSIPAAFASGCLTTRWSWASFPSRMAGGIWR